MLLYIIAMTSKSATTGIYIQVPFCQTKCTYCNFHTGVFSPKLYSPYVDAVVTEINRAPLSAPSAVVDTIYIGGGTPSLLESSALASMIGAVRSHFQTAANLEVTLEADPETITAAQSESWQQAGVNRVSLGVQSFDDAELKASGRMHRSADVAAAFSSLRQAGFTNISADLIAGMPYQTPLSWQESLDQLRALRPEHISIYLMEIDVDSHLGAEVLSGGNRYSAQEIPSDDAMADSYERACEVLAGAGYQHYEISNWGLAGFWSRHNLKYWRRETYFGFGAGAHSFDGARRWSNIHDPNAYVAAIQQSGTLHDQDEVLTPQQSLDEELFLGLRQLEGIVVSEIEARYQTNLRPRLAPLEAQGLLESEAGRTRLAASRLTISNEVFTELLSD
jgi:oxygen-independent coproporphyrinogen-3 oxidase